MGSQLYHTTGPAAFAANNRIGRAKAGAGIKSDSSTRPCCLQGRNQGQPGCFCPPEQKGIRVKPSPDATPCVSRIFERLNHCPALLPPLTGHKSLGDLASRSELHLGHILTAHRMPGILQLGKIFLPRRLSQSTLTSSGSPG